jgi:hypothetical protein
MRDEGDVGMKKGLVMTLIGTVWLLLLVVACGEAPPADQVAAPAAEDPAPALQTENVDSIIETEGTPLIVLQRTGGFAGLEDEWWFYANGRIVNHRDNQAQQVEAGEVIALHQDMLNGGFFNLAPEYMPADTCCDRFTYAVTLIEGENRHTVTTMDETESIPELLRDSLRRITTLLVSQRE